MYLKPLLRAKIYPFMFFSQANMMHFELLFYWVHKFQNLGIFLSLHIRYRLTYTFYHFKWNYLGFFFLLTLLKHDFNLSCNPFDHPFNHIIRIFRKLFSNLFDSNLSYYQVSDMIHGLLNPYHYFLTCSPDLLCGQEYHDLIISIECHACKPYDSILCDYNLGTTLTIDTWWE
jgi:hypothetical protein